LLIILSSYIPNNNVCIKYKIENITLDIKNHLFILISALYVTNRITNESMIGKGINKYQTRVYSDKKINMNIIAKRN
jgi:hypothetical protein